VHLYDQGWSLARIGERMDVAADTVRKRLPERGVTMRDTHGRPRTGAGAPMRLRMLVALDAAYISYRHGRTFAHQFGADPATAALRPLIVDGLLTIATTELWKSQRNAGSQWKAWLSFSLGIGLSLCANIASAPHLNPLTIAVAAKPTAGTTARCRTPQPRAERRHDANGSRDREATDETLPLSVIRDSTSANKESVLSPEPSDVPGGHQDQQRRFDISEHDRVPG
jgi:hypothetical protein